MKAPGWRRQKGAGKNKTMFWRNNCLIEKSSLGTSDLIKTLK